MYILQSMDRRSLFILRVHFSHIKRSVAQQIFMLRKRNISKYAIKFGSHIDISTPSKKAELLYYSWKEERWIENWKEHLLMENNDRKVHWGVSHSFLEQTVLLWSGRVCNKQEQYCSSERSFWRLLRNFHLCISGNSIDPINKTFQCIFNTVNCDVTHDKGKGY